MTSICAEVEEGTGLVCDKEMPCYITHSTDGISWGISASPGTRKKGAKQAEAESILGGMKPEKETGPPDLAEVFRNLPAIGYGDTSGHSGTDTSEDRARHEDSTGITSVRQRSVLMALGFSGPRGVTVKELREATGWHHGQASGALTNLHKKGYLARLADARAGSKIYVLPEHTEGREAEPYFSKADQALQDAKAVGWNVAHQMLCQGFRLHQVCSHSNPYEAASNDQVSA